MARKVLPLPDKELLNEFFDYVPENGSMTWKKKHGRVRPGDRAGATTTGGYLVIRFGDVLYKVARIIWMLHYGEDPGDRHLDHIDGDPTNNRLNNLRLATPAENLANRRLRKDSQSGHKNVYFDAPRNKWRVTLFLHRKVHYVGRFDRIEDAIDAAKKKREELHGNYHRHA